MDILKYFPLKIQEKIYKELKDYLMSLTEIRIRINRPIILKIGQDEKIIMYRPNYEELSEIMTCICNNSIYAFQSQICEGFITINGGHRVGISRKCSFKRWKNHKY